MFATFAEALSHYRKATGLRQADLAQAVDVTGSYVSLLEAGKRPPPTDEVTQAMERVLRLEPGVLVRLAHLERTPKDIREQLDLDRLYREGILHARAQAADTSVPVVEELHMVPLINKVAAGYPSDFTDKGYPVGVADEYIRVPDISDAGAFAVTVVGDSMEPRFREGDVLIISPAAPVGSGDFCFVRTDNNGDSRSTIKQVWFDDEGTVRLESLNRKYPSQVLPRERVGGIFRAVRRLEKL